jgi:hypothetical protein
MQSKIPHEGRCNARTRRGGFCPSYPVRGRTRCRMHGGATPYGAAHPRYKHGRYSKHCFLGWMKRADEAREKRRRALWRAFARELAKLPEEVSFPLIQATWRRVVREYEEEQARRHTAQSAHLQKGK